MLFANGDKTRHLMMPRVADTVVVNCGPQEHPTLGRLELLAVRSIPPEASRGNLREGLISFTRERK